MTKSPFRLLDLPVLARHELMKYMEPIELFEISLCSIRMSKQVRELRIQVESHDLRLIRGHSTVSVHFKRKINSIWWDFQNLFPHANMLESRKIGGINFVTCEKFQNGALSLSEYYCDYDDLEMGAATISKHFQFIFEGPLLITINPSFLDHVETIFKFPELQNCERLEIEGGEMIGEEKMKMIFDKLRVEKNLFIRRPTDSNYVINQALNVENLLLKTSTWMTRDHLLRLNCRVAQLNFTRFESQDIQDFALNWLNSLNSRIERIRFEWNSDENFVMNYDRFRSWDKEKREAIYVFKEKNTIQRVDCSNGWDLERSDGTLATVVLLDNYDNLFIHFLVWNERFPEKKRLEQLPNELIPFYERLQKINKEYPDASSMERLLSSPDLNYVEFMDTLKIYRNIERENAVPRSVGARCRKEIFEKMSEVINI